MKVVRGSVASKWLSMYTQDNDLALVSQPGKSDFGFLGGMQVQFSRQFGVVGCRGGNRCIEGEPLTFD